jgi:acetolactate synthase-1/2/3 large subunit
MDGMRAIAARVGVRPGGRVLADALVAQGIDHVFAVPGESYLDVLDGLYAVHDKLKLVTCRFEAGAVNAAEAYGKLTGRPAAAMVTRGPGACHGAIGVHIAKQARRCCCSSARSRSPRPTARASRKSTTARCSRPWPSG